MSPSVIPPSIAPRVGALLRMLASPIDGEALGAARALGRTLGGAGLDLHALADVVERPADPVVVFRDRPEPSRPERRTRKARPGDIYLHFAQRRDVAEALRRGLTGERLSSWEQDFVTSILRRLQDGHGRLTMKQGDALGRLLARLGESSAWA